MKTANHKLLFSKKSITELNDQQLVNVLGGTNISSGPCKDLIDKYIELTTEVWTS